MTDATAEIQKLQADLNRLLETHRRTRAWYWRTGLSALAAAALWIILYIAGSEQDGLMSQLAILVGALLMWILFFWAFQLHRKLNRVAGKVRAVQQRLASKAQFLRED